MFFDKLVGVAMLIDAAYSGDWSRIGAITKEQETYLQSFAPIAVGGHALCAVIAAAVSRSREEPNWALRGLKTLGGGIVTLIEVLALPDKK